MIWNENKTSKIKNKYGNGKLNQYFEENLLVKCKQKPFNSFYKYSIFMLKEKCNWIFHFSAVNEIS